MKFVVKFTAPGSIAIGIGNSTPGVKLVDRIREEAGCNLPLARINGYIDGYTCRVVEVDIPENMARESGLFNDEGEAEVEIPSHSLNNYVVEKINFSRSEDTDEITRAYVRRESDKEAILHAWAADGYPKKWDPEKVGKK